MYIHKQKLNNQVFLILREIYDLKGKIKEYRISMRIDNKSYKAMTIHLNGEIKLHQFPYKYMMDESKTKIIEKMKELAMIHHTLNRSYSVMVLI